MLFFTLAALVFQVGSSTITLEEPCIATPKLMQELSAQSGTQLSVYGTPSKYDMAVRFDHVPLSEVMKRLAYVHAGEWIRRGEGYQLQRSAKAIDEERAHNRVGLVKLILRQQKNLAKDSIQPPLDQENFVSLNQEFQLIEGPLESGAEKKYPFLKRIRKFGDPSSRLATRMVLLATPEMLSDVRPGARAVYATDPTAMEARMPAEFMEVAIEAIAESKRTNALEEERRKHLPQDERPLPASPIRQVFFVISRPPNSDCFDLSVMTDDVDGDGSDSTHTLGGPTQDRKAVERIFRGLSATEHENNLARWIVGGNYRRRNTLVDQIKESDFDVRKPEKIPPGSLIAGPLLLRSAKSKGKNLVALLNDELVADVNRSVYNYSGLEDCSASLAIEGSGWISVSPPDHSVSDEVMIDRQPLGLFLKSGEEYGCVSFGAEQEFVSDCSEENIIDNPLTQQYGRSIYGNEPCLYRDQYRALRIYSSLTPEQRNEAKRGIMFGSLSPIQQGLFNREVFGYQNYGSRWPGAGFSGIMGNTSLGLAEQCAPHGIPDVAQVRLVEEQDSTIFVDCQPKGQRRFFDFYPLPFLGRVTTSNLSEIRFVQPASILVKSILLECSRTFSSSIGYGHFERSGDKVHSVEELPEDIREIIAAAAAKEITRSEMPAPPR